MRNKIHCLACLSTLLLLASIAGCGKKNADNASELPENFSQLSDAAKTQVLMKAVSPDSLARMICSIAAGKVPGVTIDTIPIAVAYAYEHYKEDELIVFSDELDSYSANLPLAEKMAVYQKMGKADAQRLGYRLGLEYVDHIRSNRMTAAQVNEEIEAFRKACGDDTDTYNRFLKGFHIVLKQDHGKDLPEEIYKAFINL